MTKRPQQNRPPRQPRQPRQTGQTRRGGSPKGWDAVATWYDGWVGKDGSDHHRLLAIPAALDLLNPQPGEQILDIGAGQGVLAPYIAEKKAAYTGVDVSSRLLKMARQHHGQIGRFIEADARALSHVDDLQAASFDAAVFLLSIQDMNPLEAVLDSASWALKAGGRVVIVMTHPCFRIPRQSGWGFDDNRKLNFRRVDGYLTPLTVPMKTYPGQSGATISFHRPLSEYVNGLVDCGLLVDRMAEITTMLDRVQDKSMRHAEGEIPVFLGLRARKISG